MSNPCSNCEITHCTLGKYPGCLQDTRYPLLLAESRRLKGQQTENNDTVVLCKEEEEETMVAKKVWPIKQGRGKSARVVVTTQKNNISFPTIVPFAAVQNPHVLTQRPNCLAVQRCV